VIITETFSETENMIRLLNVN